MIWTILIHIFAAIGYATGAVWGIIEGLDYLINHDPVNWMFLVPLGVGLSILIANMFHAMFYRKY